jgi:hypothetical protein
MTRLTPSVEIKHLRERVAELSAVHASFGIRKSESSLVSFENGHKGWAVCECSLARLLREYSERIGKLCPSPRTP